MSSLRIASVCVAGFFGEEDPVAGLGGSEVSEKKESSSSPWMVSSAEGAAKVGIGGVVGVFLGEEPDGSGLSVNVRLEEETSGVGVSSNVSQSSSSASVLVSVAIPGARKFCSQ